MCNSHLPHLISKEITAYSVFIHCVLNPDARVIFMIPSSTLLPLKIWQWVWFYTQIFAGSIKNKRLAMLELWNPTLLPGFKSVLESIQVFSYTQHCFPSTLLQIRRCHSERSKYCPLEIKPCEWCSVKTNRWLIISQQQRVKGKYCH